MKTLLLLIFGLSVLNLTAQTPIFTGTLKMPITADTVIYSDQGDISGYLCTCTFNLVYLTSSVKVTFGGSELILNTTYVNYAFAPYVCDSLPYTISNTAYRDTTNTRGGRYPTNVKPFRIPVPVQHEKLGIRVWKLLNTGVLPYKCKFSKL